MTGEHEAFGRARAHREGERTRAAVLAFERTLRDRDIDRERVNRHAWEIEAALPTHLRAAFGGFVAAHSMARDRLTALAFGLPTALEAIERETSGDERGTEGERTPMDGCTLTLVSAARAAGGRPLVVKNRDVTFGRVQPQTGVRVPAMAGRHGFVTVTTCGSVFVSQGVNDAGLVVANTFVDRVDDTVSPAERLRTPVVVRRLLEECETVATALDLVRGLATRRLFGCALALADASDGIVLEIDPASRSVRRVEQSVVTRTNHLGGANTDTRRNRKERSSSSLRRRERAKALVPDRRMAIADLLTLAADHEPRPGPDSICRHTKAGTPNEWETVSTTVYRGGDPSALGTTGAPCAGTVRRIGVRARRSRPDDRR